MLVIDSSGPRSVFPFAEIDVEPHLCIFEFVYIARPDTRLFDREVHAQQVAHG